jgi:hypothetical protein
MRTILSQRDGFLHHVRVAVFVLFVLPLGIVAAAFLLYWRTGA